MQFFPKRLMENIFSMCLVDFLCDLHIAKILDIFLKPFFVQESFPPNNKHVKQNNDMISEQPQSH